MPAIAIAPQARSDIERFYALYNPDRIAMVPIILEDAAKRGLAMSTVFQSLYKKYAIKPSPGRFATLVELRKEFPEADHETILSAVRRCEFDIEGRPSTASAMLVNMGFARCVRSEAESYFTPPRHASEPLVTSTTLARVHSTGYAGDKSATPAVRCPEGRLMSPSSPPPAYGSSLRPTDTSEALSADRVLEEEVREWIQQLVRPYFAAKGAREVDLPLFNATLRLCDVLRDGSVLWVLQRVLANPHMEARQFADLPAPKTAGFYGRDNVCQFISFVKQSVMTSAAQHSSLFTDADLCDAKGDRAVINCLLLVSKIGAQRRLFNPKLLPAIARFEQEIEEQEAEEAAGASPSPTRQLSTTPNDYHAPSLSPSPPRPPILSPPTENAKKAPFDETALWELMRAVEFDRQRLVVHEAETRRRMYTHIRSRLSILGDLYPVISRTVYAPHQSVRDVGHASPLPHRRAPHTSSTLGPSQLPASPLRAYRPPVSIPAPSLDDKVRQAVAYAANTRRGAAADLYRWKHAGEYVVFHRITKRRTVVHVREVRNQLMIRVGGGWDLFPDWLARHVFIAAL